MKIRVLWASLLLAALVFAQERIWPRNMAQLNILTGQWLIQGGRGWIEFHYDAKDPVMIGMAKPSEARARWKKMMRIYTGGQPARVQADFFSLSGKVTHYHLVSADGGKIHFANDPVAGAPLLEFTYQKLGQDRLAYRFEKDHRVVETDVMSPAVDVRPLESRPDKLVGPLSD
jgi:hypothetical protein